MKNKHLTKISSKFNRSSRRICVRPLEAMDYWAWRTHWESLLPAQNAFDSDPKPGHQLTRTLFQQQLKKEAACRKNDTFYYFGIFLKSNGELIGQVNLMDITRIIFQNAYIGWRLHNRHWGHGYAQEAVQLALQIAYRDLKLHRVEAAIQAKNTRSLALANKIKMRYEGLSKKRLLWLGHWTDFKIFALTCEDLGIYWKKSNRF